MPCSAPVNPPETQFIDSLKVRDRLSEIRRKYESNIIGVASEMGKHLNHIHYTKA